MHLEFEVSTVEDLAKELLPFEKLVVPKSIFLLNGEMAAGKTEFVRTLLQVCFGIKDQVVSPTFSLLQTYQIPKLKTSAESRNQKQGVLKVEQIHHLDFFRLENQSDLEDIGFWDLFLDSKSSIFVEWPHNLENRIPKTWTVYQIQIQKTKADKRVVSLISRSQSETY